METATRQLTGHPMYELWLYFLTRVLILDSSTEASPREYTGKFLNNLLLYPRLSPISLKWESLHT